MLSLRRWDGLVVVAGLLGCVRGAVVPTPAMTPAPRATIGALEERQVDAFSLAQVLLTALPLSLRLMAVSDAPAVSSILWEEFLDDKKPEWFLELPEDIQSYLVVEFGPETAWPTEAATTASGDSEATATASDVPTETGFTSEQETASASDSSTLSGSEAFSTASTPTASSSSSASESSTLRKSTASLSRSSLRPSASATGNPQAPASTSSGLTRTQKLGIGLGVPFALIALAILLFCCCLACRRRGKKRVNGNEPPSSPGFIPRFSFHERGLSYEHHEHRAPLNAAFNRSSRDTTDANWEDDEYENNAIAASHRRDTFPPSAGPMTMSDSTPVMAPALFHTHSSNRARGKRTSYTSLHAVAEVAEPDESPILGRRSSPPKTGPRRPSLPTIIDIPPALAAGSIKRKPLPTSPTAASPAAETASRSLRPDLTQHRPDHSGSSSSGLMLSSASSASGYGTDSTVSPITSSAPTNPFADRFAAHHASTNPFAGGYDYLEDYGPEYSHDTHLDQQNDLYGGNRSLDRYPEPPRQSSAKTEWPLRNILGSGYRRDSSPMWDRVYESPQ